MRLHDLKKFLEPLDVGTVAGIGPKTQKALKEIGIDTLGQLAKADVQKRENGKAEKIHEAFCVSL